MTTILFLVILVFLLSFTEDGACDNAAVVDTMRQTFLLPFLFSLSLSPSNTPISLAKELSQSPFREQYTRQHILAWGGLGG